jgi:hypothetical protein
LKSTRSPADSYYAAALRQWITQLWCAACCAIATSFSSSISLPLMLGKWLPPASSQLKGAVKRCSGQRLSPSWHCACTCSNSGRWVPVSPLATVTLSLVSPTTVQSSTSSTHPKLVTTIAACFQPSIALLGSLQTPANRQRGGQRKGRDIRAKGERALRW